MAVILVRIFVLQSNAGVKHTKTKCEPQAPPAKLAPSLSSAASRLPFVSLDETPPRKLENDDSELSTPRPVGLSASR